MWVTTRSPCFLAFNVWGDPVFIARQRGSPKQGTSKSTMKSKPQLSTRCLLRKTRQGLLVQGQGPFDVTSLAISGTDTGASPITSKANPGWSTGVLIRLGNYRPPARGPMPLENAAGIPTQAPALNSWLAGDVSPGNTAAN